MKIKPQKRLVVIVVALLTIFFISQNQNQTNTTLEQLFNNQESGKMVTLQALVVKKLADDKEGDRHQKMILKTGNNTVLLAHNIDLADRVPVQTGDLIEVYGQYEWNEKGGIIHWTHRDKYNKHPNGWIKYKHKTYQ